MIIVIVGDGTTWNEVIVHLVIVGSFDVVLCICYTNAALQHPGHIISK